VSDRFRITWTLNDYSTDDCGPMSEQTARLFFEGQEQRTDIYSVDLQKFDTQARKWKTIETKRGKSKP
jgi:hypothetical protein